eukprot:TRINITY_DN10852_c0_g1_i1.p2 TRINITY_DN10852_c0_g1~~TRINITY_DN10852_c0_g1_i1.p2  ORF type:complete len:182 (-),score=43.99 TRINITY_DN10852_c0_g1_i1:49-594(-)
MYTYLLLLSLVSFAFATEQTVQAAFSWNQCGGTGVKFINLAARPSPIVLGQNVTITAAASINTVGDSSSLTSVSLHLDKKVLGVWVEVPCVDKVGSCTYEDPCSLLAKESSHICSVLSPFGIPCQCPFAVGHYSLGASGLTTLVKNPNLSWLTNGDFYAKVVLNGNAGEYLCLEVYASVTA